MQERTRKDVTNGVTWFCKQCKTCKSIRDGSFFSKSRLSLQKWFLMLWFWAREYPVIEAAGEAEIGRPVAIDIYQWLREVCSSKLIQSPVILGGPGKVVQVDESLFRHKPKVNFLYIYIYIKDNTVY